MQPPDGFEEYVVTRSPRLVHAAYLLTGDRGLAEDLVQTALARTWPHWDRIRADNPDAYVHRVLVRLSQTWWRRRWRGEVPTDEIPEVTAGGSPEADGVIERIRLARALARLPRGQRQVLVLRFVEDLSVTEVAAILRVSTGTVKSQSARGLARLREELTDD